MSLPLVPAQSIPKSILQKTPRFSAAQTNGLRAALMKRSSQFRPTDERIPLPCAGAFSNLGRPYANSDEILRGPGRTSPILPIANLQSFEFGYVFANSVDSVAEINPPISLSD